MNLVEQAVFTSAETERTAGYQLVAASPGVSDDDRRELSTWGPSHDSLANPRPSATSVNFHPLPSGNFCVSRTTASGNEYSGRGTRIYTQCLIVSPEVLSQLANNPFTIIRAASVSGLIKQYDVVPKSLEPIPLVGRAPAVDSSLLSRARRDLGAEAIASLVQAAISGVPMAIVGKASGEQTIAALLNCLPPQIRPEFSFSTGLRMSARRPFRVIVTDADLNEQRRMKQKAEVLLVDPTQDPSEEFPPVDGWPRAIKRILDTGRTSLLTRCYGEDHSVSTVDELNSLGCVLVERLGDAPPPSVSEVTAAAPPRERPSGHQRAHAPHSRFEGQAASAQAAAERPPGPSEELPTAQPSELAKLELLDDLVFDAVKGDKESLERIKQLWPKLEAELSEELLGPSREQYLRYALSVWEKSAKDSGMRSADGAITVLEVLTLLFDDA